MTPGKPPPDAMDVTYSDESSSVGGIEVVVCSDCGIRRPPYEMIWYPPNPLGIEWVCKPGLECPPAGMPTARA
jgi:hypothetical protein